MNTFGNILRLTTFGESHGPAMGGVLDGLPAGLTLDMELMANWLRRRRTGSSALVSSRVEEDVPEFLSGLSPDGLTLGTPLAFIVRNSGQRSSDYEQLRHAYRPCHADYTYDARYGIRDWRGGGRASARESVCRVVAGASAYSVLARHGVSVKAGIISVGDSGELPFVETMSRAGDFFFPEELPGEMRSRIEEARRASDSVGATVGCVVSGLPAGVGDPVYSKMQSSLAAAMFSINAVKGFDYGYGFKAAESRGSEVADVFVQNTEDVENEGEAFSFPLRLRTLSNFSGGLQGGISNGMPVYFRVAFKPAPSIATPLPTVDDKGRPMTLSVHGRHDPCVAVRGVVVVEAMTALVVADALLSRFGS